MSHFDRSLGPGHGKKRGDGHAKRGIGFLRDAVVIACRGAVSRQAGELAPATMESASTRPSSLGSPSANKPTLCYGRRLKGFLGAACVVRHGLSKSKHNLQGFSSQTEVENEVLKKTRRLFAPSPINSCLL